MKKYKITGIVYCIEPEDVDLDEEDFALRSDYLAACDDEITKINETLPNEMYISIDDDVDDEDVDDALSDVISDKTGWLVESFLYEEVPICE